MRKLALVVLLAVSAGCTTNASRMQAYVVDGVQYGVVDGRFRGRWWNYYERGRSFQDGKFFAAAEADFKTASRQRAVDQRWARTYGLHFVPEYFPHRELGVTYYLQDAYDRAIQELETSVDQRASARAEYYLNLSRKALVTQDGLDRAPPTIQILEPSGQALFGGLSARVRLNIQDDTYIESLQIAGVDYPISVSAPVVHVDNSVTLAPGVNVITLKATDVAGHSTEAEIEFRADLDGPALSFDGLVTVPGTIRGVVFDPAGVAGLRIDDEPVALASAPDDMHTFAWTVSRAGLKPLYFECEDRLGNKTRGQIPVAAILRTSLHEDLVLAATTVREFAGNIKAWYADGNLVAAVRTPDEDDAPTIRITNLLDGQHFYREEVYVNIEAVAPNGVRDIVLNGYPMTGLIPGARNQRVGRLIGLALGAENEIGAVLKDMEGTTATARVSVERLPDPVDLPENRLGLALLGNILDGGIPVAEDASEFILGRLAEELFAQGRFDLISRETMSRVLEEQELIAALGSPQARAGLEQVAAADLFLIAKTRRSVESLEIIVQAVDASTGQIAGYADVAGKADEPEELRRLLHTLSIRLAQEFPRVQGIVLDLAGDTLLHSSLSAFDRIRKNMPCLVFRRGEMLRHPDTGEELGQPAEILGEGFVESVQSRLSTIRVVPGDDIEVNDFVLTK